MREFEQPTIKLKPDSYIEKQIQHEYTLKERMILRRGMVLFSCNLETLFVEKVLLQKEVIFNLDGSVSKRNKAFYNPKCIYIQAINLKNAERKFNKIIDKYLNQKP